MKKVLLFTYDEMADFEVTFACHRLGMDGEVEIVPISYDGGVVTSACGLMYQSKFTVDQALELADVRGLIIPGGRTRDIRENILALVRKIHGNGGMLAAICLGPQFLAQAGVLEGKRFTTSADPEYFKETGEPDYFPWESFKDNNVTVDGPVITAKGTCFVDFGIAVCNHFGVYRSRNEMEAARREFKGLEADLRDGSH